MAPCCFLSVRVRGGQWRPPQCVRLSVRERREERPEGTVQMYSAAVHCIVHCQLRPGQRSSHSAETKISTLSYSFSLYLMESDTKPVRCTDVL